MRPLTKYWSKPKARPSAPAQPSFAEAFEVDLHEALASTQVSEISFGEFLAVLKQGPGHRLANRLGA